MSVTTMLRATKKQDEWMTPDYAVKALLPFLPKKANILCPFDMGASEFKLVLQQAGHYVTYTHIDWPKGKYQKDFFEYTAEEVKDFDFIISNPPYSQKDAVFEKLFELDRPFAMLMGATAGLFEGKRFSLFKNKKLEIMWLKPRVAYIDQNGVTMKSPPFQSCYVCHKVLPKPYLFVELEK
jgi:hypothetical protein